MKKILIFLGIAVAVVIIQLLFTPAFDQLELITYDLRAKLAIDSGPFSKKFRHADQNIVIITVDDYSKNEIAKNPQLNLGSWPWRRDVWAEVVNFVEKGKPKAILFDIIFSSINSSFSYDNELANTFQKYNNIVLATSLNNPKFLMDKVNKSENKEILSNYFIPTKHPLDVQINNKSLEDKMTYYTHAPIYNCYSKFNTMAVVNKTVKNDAVIRATQPIFKLIKGDKEYYMPSLAFAGFLKVMGEDGQIVIKNNKIFYKGREIPLDNDATTYISWHGLENLLENNLQHDYPFISISDVLLSQHDEKFIKADYFKDKIVIIGRTEASTDIHPTAVNSKYAGPEVNATALDNFLNDTDRTKLARKFIVQMPVKVAFVLTLAFCLLIAGIILASKNALFAFFNSVLLVLVYVLICMYAFINPAIRVWIPAVVPLYYILATSAIFYTFRLQQESAKKAEIMNMFGKFVSPKVLPTLLKSKEGLVLKNTKKPITVMFCDVKDFTTLSEKSDPEQLVNNLNELFNEIVNIVFENNGTVDKFIGDCVMAYWGEPVASEDDSFMAVKTALEIKKKVKELQLKNIKENKIMLDVKIGINTGDALLGLIGSNRIMSYTAMGDAVNTASRLESSCSKLKRDILISKATYEEVKDKIIAIDVGKIGVKGKDEQIEAFEPIELSQKS